MFIKEYSKDQKLVLLGVCLYYMGLGGFLFNSQTSVLASVRAIYNFPMTRISLYTSFGYAATILGSALLGPVIYKLPQKGKKLYFEGMYFAGVAGFLMLGFFAETPLFFIARFLIGLSVSTISIITPYMLNQWIHYRTSTAIGISAAFTGLGGMISNPLSSFLCRTFSFQKGILILILISACFTLPSFYFLFRRPVPEGEFKRPASGKTAGSGSEISPAKASFAALVILVLLVASSRVANLFVSYLSIFAQSEGYSEAFGASMASLLMFGSIAAKLIYGALCDRIGTWKATSVCELGVGAAMLLFLFLPQYTAVICIGTLCYGMIYGLTNMSANRMCMAALGYEGTRKYQGLLTAIGSVAGLVCSPMVGIIYDNTGNFHIVFISLALMMAVCILLCLAMDRMNRQKAE
jgi:MFS family permease